METLSRVQGTFQTQGDTPSFNWMGNHGSISVGRNIRPKNVRTVDTDGSLLVEFEDGTKWAAALPGSSMDIVGTFLFERNEFEDCIIGKMKEFSTPLPLFVSAGEFIGTDDSGGTYYEEHEELLGSSSMRVPYDTAPGISGTVDNVDIEEGSSGALTTEALSGESDTEEDGKCESIMTQETRIHFLRKKKRIRDAVANRKIFRLVSQHSLGVGTPFIGEIYPRINELKSPYNLYDSNLIEIYRMWTVVGSHQAFFVRTLEEFLKARERIAPAYWNIDVLESFLVCGLHTERDLVNAPMNVTPQDYEDIEGIMIRNLKKELVKSDLEPRFSPESDAVSRADESGSETHGGVTILSPKEYPSEELPDDVWYLHQSELLEIKRMYDYEQKKIGIIEELYKDPSISSKLANPFASRLQETQRANGTQINVKHLLPRATSSSTGARKAEETNADAARPRPRKSGSYRNEARYLQDVLETIVTAHYSTQQQWAMYMELMRKLKIETEDICKQVRRIQQQTEKAFDKKHEKPNLAGINEVALSLDVLGGKETSSAPGEETFDPEKATARIAAGNGVSIPEGLHAYDPDSPHLPLTTLRRLEHYIEQIDAVLISAMEIDVTQGEQEEE